MGNPMLQVEIRTEGHLDEQWSEWLADLKVTHTEQNETILAGPIADQAALYGLITRLRDLGIKLVSVESRDSSIEQGSQPPIS